MTICDLYPIMLIVEISKKLHLIDGRKEFVFQYILKKPFFHNLFEIQEKLIRMVNIHKFADDRWFKSENNTR